MRRAVWIGSLTLLCLILILAGCGGGVDETVWTGTGIHGYVTAGRGDYAVAGAAVNLYTVAPDGSTYQPTGGLSGPPDATTITSATGYYRFTGLAPGCYLVEVPSTADRAGARYQYLKIDLDGQQ